MTPRWGIFEIGQGDKSNSINNREKIASDGIIEIQKQNSDIS